MNNWIPFMFMASLPRSRRTTVATAAAPLVVAANASPLAATMAVMTIDQNVQRAVAREHQLATEAVALMADKSVTLTEDELQRAPRFAAILEEDSALADRLVKNDKPRSTPTPGAGKDVAELRSELSQLSVQITKMQRSQDELEANLNSIASALKKLTSATGSDSSSVVKK